jgi:hypothetical protein
MPCFLIASRNSLIGLPVWKRTKLGLRTQEPASGVSENPVDNFLRFSVLFAAEVLGFPVTIDGNSGA